MLNKAYSVQSPTPFVCAAARQIQNSELLIELRIKKLRGLGRLRFYGHINIIKFRQLAQRSFDRAISIDNLPSELAANCSNCAVSSDSDGRLSILFVRSKL